MPLDLQQYDLMVVSDLHLSEGRSADTKKFSLNEDFFFDEEFARLLDYQMHRIAGRDPERHWNLIVNGDFLDFLQVTSTSEAPDFLQYLKLNHWDEALQTLSFDRENRDYGFGCGPHETVYKLWKIMDGHWLFFEALANFLVEGNVLSIGRGNHDVEFVYPEVQNAFAPKLRRLYDNRLSRDNDPQRDYKLTLFDKAVQDQRIRFIDWFYYERGLIWVEHGNQYDAVNAFKYWLAPKLPAVSHARPDEIDLPWGSFFVRYLFNCVEMQEPFADNIKPQGKFIKWFLTHHPWMAFTFLYGDGRYMLKKAARAFRRVPEDAYRERKQEHFSRLYELAASSGIDRDRLASLDAARAAPVLTDPQGVWKLIRILTRGWFLSLTLLFLLLLIMLGGAITVLAHAVSPLIPEQVRVLFANLLADLPRIAVIMTALRWPLTGVLAIVAYGFVKWLLADRRTGEACYLVDRARKISEMMDVKYVTMGHTHDSDLQSIGKDGQEYFNTGTWTKVFSEEEQIIRDPSELLVLEGVRHSGGMTVKLFQWEDAAQETRLVKLFQ